MEREYVMQVAETIRQQLLGTTPMNVICSWGALHGFKATTFKDMATLKFYVKGRLFKGYVLIAYNEMDYYEIYLQNESRTKCIHEECYFDQLGEVIDVAIERGEDAEEYERFCEEEHAKLMRGEIG